MEEKVAGMLSPYRVLDLTDEKGLLCGKLLGDLGADVIKIERPGGDPARRIGPFYHDEVDPEKSLFWWAFNTSKRGITLDIETTDGQETFKKLVQSADFVIESFPPGYLDRLGLGYSALEKLNPGIILVSITPFGQTGPYKDYKGPDIVAWAMGGQMYPWGDADRPPVRISHHSQSHLHGAGEAVAGALLALHHREKTGEGQQVDVSIQDSVAQDSFIATTSWDMRKINQQRGGQLPGLAFNPPAMWPCKDGYFTGATLTGLQRGIKPPFFDWMEEEGMADDFIKGFDWSVFSPGMTDETPEARQARIEHLREVMERVEAPTLEFIKTHTKAELFAGALKYRIMLFPVSTAADILESVQLAARGFWVELEHPELGATITYPGPFIQTSEVPPRVSRRAPLIGEHNREILEQESGLPRETAATPRQTSSSPARLNKERLGRGQKLLEGVRVVDFSWAIAGPLTTKMFSDYGAEVVKIEGQSRSDPARLQTPYKDDVIGLNRSGSFNQWNTGKINVAINLTHPKGLEIAKRFVARADIVMENFAGGVLEKMGLGYEELKKVKPDIIMLSSSMHGQTGPHANHPGYGHQLIALSGYCHITGWPDRGPMYIGPYTDYIAPHFSIAAFLAALDYRRRTGKGQYFDLSQYETGIAFLAPIILDYSVNQRVANRMGNRYPYAAPHNAYPCRGEERWCAIAAFTDEEWQSFIGVIGSPAWTKDPKFTTLTARKENEDELDRLVGEWTINHSAEEVMNKVQTAGVAAGVVETGEDMLEHDPQYQHRHFFWELDHPEMGKFYAPGPSFQLSKSPYDVRPTSVLGADNEHALKELLGMSDEEITELAIEGVFD